MPCGVPELGDVRAVGRAERLAMERAPAPECPACETETNPSLFATCEAGRCVAVDLRQDALSACAADEECVVTEPDCCACRPGWAAVRRGAEADFFRRQCGETPICSPCERHEVPAHLVGRCVEGHCVVAEGPPPACHSTCERVEQERCQPDGAPCTCAYLHQPFADCEPGPDRPCPSARAFYVACDPRCCAAE